MKYIILAVLLITACNSSEPQPTTKLAEPADAIDQNLMVALSKAKNFHHKAKVYMSDGNTTAAIASVREILSLQFPANAPDADDVRNEARAALLVDDKAKATAEKHAAIEAYDASNAIDTELQKQLMESK